MSSVNYEGLFFTKFLLLMTCVLSLNKPNIKTKKEYEQWYLRYYYK